MKTFDQVIFDAVSKFVSGDITQRADRFVWVGRDGEIGSMQATNGHTFLRIESKHITMDVGGYSVKESGILGRVPIAGDLQPRVLTRWTHPKKDLVDYEREEANKNEPLRVAHYNPKHMQRAYQVLSKLCPFPHLELSLEVPLTAYDPLVMRCDQVYLDKQKLDATVCAAIMPFRPKTVSP